MRFMIEINTVDTAIIRKLISDMENNRVREYILGLIKDDVENNKKEDETSQLQEIKQMLETMQLQVRDNTRVPESSPAKLKVEQEDLSFFDTGVPDIMEYLEEDAVEEPQIVREAVADSGSQISPEDRIAAIRRMNKSLRGGN